MQSFSALGSTSVASDGGFTRRPEVYRGLLQNSVDEPTQVQRQRAMLTDLIHKVLECSSPDTDHLPASFTANIEGRIIISDAAQNDVNSEHHEAPAMVPLTQNEAEEYMNEVFGTPETLVKEWNALCPLMNPELASRPRPGATPELLLALSRYAYQARKWIYCLHQLIMEPDVHFRDDAEPLSNKCLAHLSGWQDVTIAFPDGQYSRLASDSGWGEAEHLWEAFTFYEWRHNGGKTIDPTVAPHGPPAGVACLLRQEHAGFSEGLSRGELTSALAMIDYQMWQQRKPLASVIVHSVTQDHIRHIQVTLSNGKFYILRTGWTQLTRDPDMGTLTEVFRWLLAQPPRE